MAIGLNRWEGIGNLGSNPEVKGDNENAPATFSVAISRNVKKGDTTEEVTQWFRCVAFGNRKKVVMDYLKKGMKVFVSGEVVFKEWEKDGVKHNSVDIFVDNIQMLDKKETSTSTSTTASTKPASTPNATPGDLDF